MKFTIIEIAALAFLAATPAFAQRFSGYLVDSGCYAARQRNVNPKDTLYLVDRDKDSDVRYCSPNKKTKSFAIVNHDGVAFQLDPAGNAKAAEIVLQTGKKDFLEVHVTGEVSKNAMKVDSMSLPK